jgi:hypothetical protein
MASFGLADAADAIRERVGPWRALLLLHASTPTSHFDASASPVGQPTLEDVASSPRRCPRARCARRTRPMRAIRSPTEAAQEGCSAAARPQALSRSRGSLAEARRRADNHPVAMSLLAYSVRRTVGAVLVLLVLIWVIQFAVYHITDSPGYEGRGGVMFLPRFLYPGLHFQPALANEWSTAAVEVGLGLLLLLAVGVAWRLRNQKAV